MYHQEPIVNFVGNEFGELMSSFCVNNKIGTVLHRAKADMKLLLSVALHSHRISELPGCVDSDALNMNVNNAISHLLDKYRAANVRCLLMWIVL